MNGENWRGLILAYTEGDRKKNKNLVSFRVALYLAFPGRKNGRGRWLPVLSTKSSVHFAAHGQQFVKNFYATSMFTFKGTVRKGWDLLSFFKRSGCCLYPDHDILLGPHEQCGHPVGRRRGEKSRALDVILSHVLLSSPRKLGACFRVSEPLRLVIKANKF